MPAVGESGRNVITAKSRIKKKRYGAAGRGADTTSSTREPVTRGTAFAPVATVKPFSAQADQAQRKVDQSRRRLPVTPIAAPPVIRNPSPAQVRAGKQQIVRSVQAATAGLRGRERQEAQARLLREIATDPRHAATRRAIASYTAAERARSAPQTRAELRPGRGDTLLGAPKQASFLPKINLSAARRRLEAMTPGLQGGDGPGQFARNSLRDVGSLASAPFVGGLALADVAGDVLTGHPGEAGRKVVGFGKGVAASTWHDVQHPEQAVLNHPVLSLLNVAGAASVAGRTAGAVARGAGSTAEAGGLRGALARGASTVRPPIALVDDGAAGGLVERSYSKDLGRKAVQVAADARREPVRHPDGSVVTVTQRGRTVPVLKPTGEIERVRLARGRGDFVASRANLAERSARDEAGAGSAVRGRVGAAVRRSEVPGVRGRAARDVVAMVAEGTVTSAAHFVDDLKARLRVLHDALDDPAQYRHEGERAKAIQEAATIERVLNSPRALKEAPRIVAAGEALGRRQIAADAENATAGLGDAAQLKRARLLVAAQAHLGGRHFTEKDHADAEAAARAAGDHALADAVSGKHQGKLRSHRAASARVEDARGRARAAAAEQARLEGKVRAMVGAQSVRRGQEAAKGPVSKVVNGQRVSLSAADARRVGELSAARRSARAARTRRRAAEKELRIAQHEFRQNPDPPRGEGMRTPEGKQITDQEIEDFLRSRGRDPESVAFLPHRADVVGNAAYHSQMRPGSRPTLDKGETRTGAAYARGGQGTTAQLLQDQGVRQAVQLTKARQIDKLIGEHGLRHPAWAKAERGEQLTPHERRVVDKNGGYFTPKQAKEAMERAQQDTGQRLVAVSAFPAKLDSETQRIIREDYQGPGGMESLGQRLLNSRFLTEDELKGGRGTVVLMNRDLVDRLNKHLAPSTGVGRFAQVLNKAFRYAVLPTPKWVMGELVEPWLVRLPAAGTGAVNVFGVAMDLRAANQTLKAMDRSGDPRVRAAAAEIRAQQFGGTLFGNKGLTNRRGLSDFPVLDAAAQKAYGRLVAKLPATRHMLEISDLLLRKGAAGVMAPLKTVMTIGGLSGKAAQRVAFGRQVRRDVQEFTGSWAKTVWLGKKAAEEAAKGLTNTPTQARFMKASHELIGKYDGFPPTLRAVIQGPAPFLPWALNAARFTMWTMPAHHTALTAFLVQINGMVEKDWNELHEPVKGLKGGLQLAIPNGKGGWVDIARYTPYGLSGPIAKGDPKALTSQFYPQISGASAAIEGKDPFGRDARTSTGKSGDDIPVGQRIGMAANSLAEATVPYLSTARRLRERGETSFADSTVVSPRTKAGTSHGMSAARRVWDPLRPTYVGASGAGQVVDAPAGPSGGGSSPGGVPASVQRALQRIQAAEDVGRIPESVQRALQRIR